MNNTQNVTIVLLLISAMVLGGLLISTYRENQAYAGMPSLKAGDYVLGAGAWSNNVDLIYVIDVAARQLNVYYADEGNNRDAGKIENIDSVDLEKAFQ